MIKIALTTIGSRGDIQPYISLGCALKQNGYLVAIFTHPFAKDLINQYNLEHVPIGDDTDLSEIIERLIKYSSNDFKAMKHAMKFIFSDLRKCHIDLLNKLKDYDLIIGHGLVGQSEAAMLEKPFIVISLAPIGLEKEFWKSNNYLKEFGVWLSSKLLEKIFAGPYIRFRKEIGAPSLKQKSNFPYLAIVPFSSSLLKRNRNWRERTEITGFLFSDIPSEYTPSKGLIQFINGGEKPIFITLGSMLHDQVKILELYQIISDAILKSNTRAILLLPGIDRIKTVSNEKIFLVNNIPYDWLLKYVDIVIHHFGFGTTAEVLKAGIPSIPIPHIFDQKMRAKEMYKKGLASKPLNLNDLDSNILSKAILYVKDDINIQTRCKDIGKRISNENGNEEAVLQIKKYIEELSTKTQ